MSMNSSRVIDETVTSMLAFQGRDMQLPGLVQGHLRKLHLINIIFAMEGAHLSLRVHRTADSLPRFQQKAWTVLIAAHD